ncbi:retrotransposon gag protein, partial [Trifolium medium]|nr:retrotransposon gag protein [Trifolium medium]
MLEKCFGKKFPSEEVSGPELRVSPEKTVANGASSSAVHSDAMTEFRHAVKKVELPTFNGEDPAGWISRAEIYFSVQETTPEVKVRLAQICMEG